MGEPHAKWALFVLSPRCGARAKSSGLPCRAPGVKRGGRSGSWCEICARPWRIWRPLVIRRPCLRPAS